MLCKSLTSVIIPKNVTYIGVGAFLHCKNIREVTCGSDQPLYISSYIKPDIFHSNVYENANLYVHIQYDSDVATFVHQVTIPTGINTPLTDHYDISVGYTEGTVTIDGAEGADCKIYDMSGR